MTTDVGMDMSIALRQTDAVARSPTGPSRPSSAIAWPIALAALACIVVGLAAVVDSRLDPAISAILVMLCGMAPAVVFDGAPKVIRAWRSGPPASSLARIG